MSDFDVIGKSTPQIDGMQKAMGRTKYVSDLVLDDRGRLTPSLRVRRKIRKLRWRSWWKQRGLKRHDPAIQAQLRGYEGFLHMLDS